MTKNLLQFKKDLGERPYEKSKLELIRSALDFHEDFLTFLKNEEEDLSSLFCSELVAAAYQHMGLLESDPKAEKYKTSNEYTPDDFTSARDKELNLKYGELGKEVYIEMKFQNYFMYSVHSVHMHMTFSCFLHFKLHSEKMVLM